MKVAKQLEVLDLALNRIEHWRNHHARKVSRGIRSKLSKAQRIERAKAGSRASKAQGKDNLSKGRPRACTCNKPEECWKCRKYFKYLKDKKLREERLRLQLQSQSLQSLSPSLPNAL